MGTVVVVKTKFHRRFETRTTTRLRPWTISPGTLASRKISLERESFIRNTLKRIRPGGRIRVTSGKETTILRAQLDRNASTTTVKCGPPPPDTDFAARQTDYVRNYDFVFVVVVEYVSKITITFRR